MLHKIFRTEFRLLFSDKTVGIALSLFLLLSLYAAQNGKSFVSKMQRGASDSEQYARRLDSLQTLADKETAKLQAEKKSLAAPAWGVRHPQFAAFRASPTAYLPPSALAAFSIGQSDVLTRTFKIQLDLQRTLEDEPDIQNPLALFTGRIDFAFVIIYLLPLLVLALSFNVLSAERENGTLALLFSQPISLGTVIGGKLTVRFLVIALIVIAASLVVFIGGVLPVTPENVSSADLAGRLGLWIFASLAYALLWFALAALVNAIGKNSATNAMILAACWLLFLVIIPSVLNAAAATLYPIPSRVEFINSQREAGAAANARTAKRMEKFYFDHPELAKDTAAKDNDFAIEYLLSLDDEAQSLAPVTEKFKTQLARQHSAVQSLRFLSPAILMHDVLTRLAGTDTGRYQDFVNQTQRFQETWVAYFRPIAFAREAVTNYRALPVFEHNDDASAHVSPTLTGIVFLFSLSLITLFVALKKLQSYSIA
jgi:ABC-2 type transport system permease protein